MLTRRRFTGVLIGSSIAGLTSSTHAQTATGHSLLPRAPRTASPRKVATREQRIREQLTAIQTDVGGRLGVAIFDVASGMQAGLRMNERFPMCSTFKFLAAAAVLQRADRGEENLTRKIVFDSASLVHYSPVTEKHTGSRGMTVAELCEAAITLSDNTAANLLLASLGGPKGVTAFARRLGDRVTRLDRIEPDLNESVPGDARDTTSPAAMLGNMRKLLLGDALTPSSRTQLEGWLIANQTGGKRIRAGVPKDWRIGDKTGSGQRGTTNDIAILWPPARSPMLVSIYLTGTRSSAERSDAALAEVGSLIATTF